MPSPFSIHPHRITMSHLFIPPSFEPNSPREPQWFPRPITDSIESSLDLLERLEEDRERRLRSIRNVAARTPIGLGGIEDHGHPGTAGNLSPKPAAPGNNNYARYRYYPPPSEASASLHASYQRTERFLTSTPASVTTRRDRHHRRGATPRSIAARGGAVVPPAREGAMTPVDGIGTAATPASIDRAYVEDSREATPRRGDRSFRSASSSAFLSPPLDPRAGGGGRRLARGMRSPRHYQRRSPGETFGINIDTTVAPTTGDEEWVTPPAMTQTDQTPGHGQVDDVYSQRRTAGQRRRRRGWDEINI